MIIIMKPKASDADIKNVVDTLSTRGFKTVLNKGDVQAVIAAIGDKPAESTDEFQLMDGVRSVQRIQVPYKLVSRDSKHTDTVVELKNGTKIGGNNKTVMMAGPCSVESEEVIMEIATFVASKGATILRGGAFKPRTGPRGFEGLGEEGLKYMRSAADKNNMAVISEIMDANDLDMMCDYVDILQVGARNMQNFSMLNKLGKANKPVLLKRGMAATIDEWLLAAERLMHHGCEEVIFCERGIRSFDSKYTRNVGDLCTIPLLRKLSHLPIVFDPSHATGAWGFVPPMTKAAVIAGAHAVIVEAHSNPAKAFSDGPQSLNFERFEKLMTELDPLYEHAAHMLSTGI